MESEFWIDADDKTKLYIKKWEKHAQKPKAIIQLAHGMVEHIQRYDAFAKFLTEQGYIVYGNDHRGHGQTGILQGKLGYFAKDKGFTKVTNDLVTISKMIKKEHPTIPLYLFGHSMGSFLARTYIQESSNVIDGVILSGTGFYPCLTAYMGRLIASNVQAEEPSLLMNNLIFKANNKRVKKPRTEFDWLTRDEGIINDYIKDPYAGFIPTGQFFYDLMTGLIELHHKKANKRIRKDLPILLISGEEDPIGNYGKGVMQTAKSYHKIGLTNVSVMLFENGRHELINETNKQEVFHFIHSWLQKQLYD